MNIVPNAVAYVALAAAYLGEVGEIGAKVALMGILAHLLTIRHYNRNLVSLRKLRWVLYG